MLTTKMPSLQTPASGGQRQPPPSEVVDELALARARRASRSTRPYVLLNMVSTADGRATLGGRSGPLGGRADRELFHGLRTAVDAVMVGAGTVRAERYGRLDPRRVARRRRRERGLSEEPLACIVSGRLCPGQRDPAARRRRRRAW